MNQEQMMKSQYAYMTPQLIASMQQQKDRTDDITRRLDKWGNAQVSVLRQLKPVREVKSIYGSQNSKWLHGR